MAIYHLEAKVVSRGAGRSAVAASAYLSCTNILNDYDGVRHDFTRKKGLVWQDVFLPEFAPPEWKDRGVLWNAVEENEKTKDSRLAREFVPALPVELTPAQWQELLTDFIQNSFVAEGMCADVAIHDPHPPGHKPYTYEMARVIVREMIDQHVLDMVEKGIVTDQIVMTIGYDIENLTDSTIHAQYHGEVTTDFYGRKVPKHAHGTANLKRKTSSSRIITDAAMELFDRIVDHNLLIRRINIVACKLTRERDLPKEH